MATTKQTIEIVNSLQLLGFLTTNGSACRFVGITYKTEVVKGKGIKTSHPFGRIFKVSKFCGLINADFVEAVKARIAAKLDVEKSAVDYTAGKSSYAHPFPASPCVVVKAKTPDDGEYYLHYFPDVSKAEAVFVNEGGDVIDRELVKPWLYAKSERADWKPAIVSLKLANIVEMRASGLILSTEDIDEAKAALAAA